MDDLGKILIRIGLLFLCFGVAILLLKKFGVPSLPGDIQIKRENFTFYFPIVTSVVVSIVLTILFNLFFRK